MPELLKAREILNRYWGFSSFRPLQEDIIHSVVMGDDTLALLPTGGGKSLCFQVPALLMPGICIVVTPLIALMKDQVSNLNKKGIRATAIYSGMDRRDMEVTLDNCRFGQVRFLYVSPERLQSVRFIETLKQLQVNLLAVDEAHCISQWGYDFRPPYLQIASIRELFPDIPVLALTATATPDVVTDIQDKLRFRQPNVFQKSFERKNLTYVVYKEEDKLGRLLRIIRNVKGSGIVYVRNRRKTKEIAGFLEKNQIRAGHYHAGLDPKVRERRQDEWISGKTDVMVATNAFGMGIDKPDVRYVVHMDLTDSLEAYFQEAGRAGRDGQRSYAVMLYEQADILQAVSNFNASYPDLKTIRTTYHLICNNLGIPVGGGADQSFDFDLHTFSRQYNLRPVNVFNALKILGREGYLQLSEGMNTPSKLFLKVNNESLYHFQVAHPAADGFIKTLLRSYSGLFSDFIPISEAEIARRSSMTKEQTIRMLQRLQDYELLTYLPQRDKPQIVLCRERLDEVHLDLSESMYQQRKEMARKRLEAVIAYISDDAQCRSVQLLAYFGEKGAPPCGTCDTCRAASREKIVKMEHHEITEKIRQVLHHQSLTMQELAMAVGSIDDKLLVQTVRWLLDHKKITLDSTQKMRWNK